MNAGQMGSLSCEFWIYEFMKAPECGKVNSPSEHAQQDAASSCGQKHQQQIFNAPWHIVK